MARVLVVEDEPGIALGLEDSLRLEGYQVEVVDNGASASRRALEEAFDLVLLDVMLPGKSGFDVCRELRRSGFEAPIIFLTARTQEGDRIEGLDLGANDYVTKPFSPRELMARVRGLLRFVESSRHDRKRLEEEVDAASQVQQRLFPSSQPSVAGLDYFGKCLPAFGVSGDFYDYFTLPSGCLALLLADVCGKGMPAALVAASLHATVRAYGPAAGRNCGELLAEVNRILFATTTSERFVTMFYAVYDPSDSTLTYTNAGHCPPLWVRPGGRAARLDSLFLPAGIAPEVPVLQETIRLAPGDFLLAYSDGLTEACNPEGEEFGEARLLDLAVRESGHPVVPLSNTILDAVKHFTSGGHQADDVTVLSAKSVVRG
jgi:sigma-B regulation protein RsbU (phosphoserine phosphatase)